jgi:hypothetical protein
LALRGASRSQRAEHALGATRDDAGVAVALLDVVSEVARVLDDRRTG